MLALPASRNPACAAVINVKAVGATGDGTTDDGGAIQRAIDTAIKSTSPRGVYLPAGSYLFGTTQPGAQRSLVVSGARDLVVYGDAGTKLISASPSQNLLTIVNSTNVRVRNVELIRQKRLFSQVTVKTIGASDNSVIVAVERGYDPLDTPELASTKTLMVFSDPAGGSWGDHSQACAWYRPTDASVCWPPTIIRRAALAPGEWKLWLNTSPSADYIGKTAVVWGGPFAAHAFAILGTDGFEADNLTYLAKGDDGLFVLHNDKGNFEFDHVSLTPTPGTDEFVSAIGGAMVFNNHIKLKLNAVKIVGVYDDCLNIGANFARIFKALAARSFVVDGTRADFIIGDTMQFWNWQSKTIEGTAKLVSLDCTGTKPKSCLIGTDGDVKVAQTGYAPIRSGGNENEKIDRVIDLESAGSIDVESSEFQSFHARDLLIKASNSQVINSLFENTVAAGILVGPEFFWDEGPTVNNLTIAGNTFRNVSGPNILVEDGAARLLADNHSITVSDNRFIDFGQFQHGVMGKVGTPVQIHDVDGVTLTGNSFQSRFATKTGAALTDISGNTAFTGQALGTPHGQ